jgi:serine protease Do
LEAHEILTLINRRSNAMKARRRTLVIPLLLAVLFAIAVHPPARAADDTQSLPSFHNIADKVSPSVVNIRATQVREVQVPQSGFSFGNSPFEQFFPEQFFKRSAPPQTEETYKQFRPGEGSGIIISADGYILTNNHVVANADALDVTLIDGRAFKAETIGTDPLTELALIKVDATGLRPAKLGDSDDAQVGDWVLAIGNPFGLENTVTQGIISAKDRSNFRIAKFSDFIQTTAFINPGNSGGPLVNLDGEVIGINTWIFTGGGAGFIGIGFAVPTNMAKYVIDSLIENGNVTRGWLGVVIQELTPDLAKSFGLKDTKGVLLDDVVPDGPADEGGLTAGDVIVAYRGDPLERPSDLQLQIAETKPGTKANIRVIRDGKTINVGVKIAERELEGKPAVEKEAKTLELGFEVETLTPEAAGQLGYPGLKGVLVTQVMPGSPAYFAGLAANDVILSVDTLKVTEKSQFDAALSKTHPIGGVRLRVRRGEFSTFIFLRTQ